MTSFPSDVFQSCNGCHVLNPANGFFGSDGFSSFENEPQLLKIPHLRNLYQKIGMFGMPAVPFFNAGDNGHKGDQIRGFGFLHDGSVDTIFRFHNAQLSWKRLKGAQTDTIDFGDPVAGTTAYTPCVYSGTASDLIMEVQVPRRARVPASRAGSRRARGSSTRTPPWRAPARSRYCSRPGARARRRRGSRARVATLPLPAFAPTGLALPVTVQLNNIVATA